LKKFDFCASNPGFINLKSALNSLETKIDFGSKADDLRALKDTLRRASMV